MKKTVMVLFLFLMVMLRVDGFALTMKGVPTDFIKSQDGHITVGFEKEWGGAISYIKDDRIADSTEAQGNMLNNSNSGALFSTAIWTLKNFNGWDKPSREIALGWCDKRTKKYFPRSSTGLDDWNNNKIECFNSPAPLASDPPLIPETLPFNNPTQGGVAQHAWENYPATSSYGRNPNQTIVTISNNRAHISTRLVNFNYNFEGVIPLATNPDVQTDFWLEEDVYFHPVYKDVLVVDQKNIYCKDMNAGCKNQSMVVQDTQLSTMFPAVTTYASPFSGPFDRFVFREVGKYNFYAVSTGVNGYNSIENWQASVRSDNQGIGEAVYKYKNNEAKCVGKGEGCGYSMGGTALSVTSPNLSLFENGGINSLGTGDPRFAFNPGGWYKFRTFIATGDLTEIRRKLLAVVDLKMNPDTLTNLPNVSTNIVGYIDRLTCSDNIGWVKDASNNNYKVTLSAEYYSVDNYAAKIVKTTVANVYRSDLASGACFEGKCLYGISVDQFPVEFKDKKIKVRTWATAADGSINLVPYGGGADSIIGPCTNIAASIIKPTNTPIPTLKPTLKPTPTLTPVLGDYNGDRKVDLVDFGVWKTKYLAGKMTLVDFGVWKKAYLTN